MSTNTKPSLTQQLTTLTNHQGNKRSVRKLDCVHLTACDCKLKLLFHMSRASDANVLLLEMTLSWRTGQLVY